MYWDSMLSLLECHPASYAFRPLNVRLLEVESRRLLHKLLT